MQSDGNSFCGDVVMSSFIKTSRDEDKFLDQTYKCEYVRVIIMMILILYNIRECTKTQLYELLVDKGCISFNMHFPQSLLKLKSS